VIGRRLGRLSEGCRTLLSTASVLGRDVDLDALAAVSGLGKDDVLDVLDEARAARVLLEVPGVAPAADRMRFSHALIRDVLYEELGPARRVRLHRQVGETLERLYAQDPEPHLAELAHHFTAAAAGGQLDKAIHYARHAGERAAQLLAFEEAVRLFQVALRTLESRGARDKKTRCELLLALGDAHARAGDEPKAKETFLRAADAARDAGSPEQRARAALGYGGRFVWARAGTDQQLVPFLESALTALGENDSPLRVRLLARLAGALRDQDDREPRAALSQEALEMARRIDDPATLVHALDGRCMAIFWPENPEERIAIANELIQLAEEVGDRERAAAARYYRMMFLLELGDMSAVSAGLDAYGRLAEELRQPAQLWLLVATRATLALFEGRFEEAEALIEQALAFGQHAQGADAVLSHRIHVFTLRWQRGDLDGLEETLTRSALEYPARPMFRCMLARLYADLDREADARLVFDDLASDDFATLPRTNEWLFSLGFLADVAAYLGDATRARTLYKLLSPHTARNACTADYISTGSVSRSLGVVASTLSRWQDAERHFEDALQANGRMGARPWLAHAQHEYARMLLTRDEPGDRGRASRLLASCLGAFRELGMDVFAQRASGLEPAARAGT
jgi:tetratricopeptide (TPR) repeat protein